MHADRRHDRLDDYLLTTSPGNQCRDGRVERPVRCGNHIADGAKARGSAASEKTAHQNRTGAFRSSAPPSEAMEP